MKLELMIERLQNQIKATERHDNNKWQLGRNINFSKQQSAIGRKLLALLTETYQVCLTKRNGISAYESNYYQAALKSALQESVAQMKVIYENAKENNMAFKQGHNLFTVFGSFAAASAGFFPADGNEATPKEKDENDKGTHFYQTIFSIAKEAEETGIDMPFAVEQSNPFLPTLK